MFIFILSFILSNPNISGSLSIGRIASAPDPIPLWPSPTPIPPSKVGRLNIAPLEYQATDILGTDGGLMLNLPDTDI